MENDKHRNWKPSLTFKKNVTNSNSNHKLYLYNKKHKDVSRPYKRVPGFSLRRAYIFASIFSENLRKNQNYTRESSAFLD